MIIPKEKPYMDGLNSYYLQTDRFIEHLQGEIGTGCIYFKSSTREILVYFDEMDIINGVIQESGERARVTVTLEPVFDALQQRNYLVKVFYLDSNAIFYWAQMPPFKRARNNLDSSEISLADLVERLARKKASCFIDVRIPGAKRDSMVFFHRGHFVGGSYSWGTGGLNPSKSEFEAFLLSVRDKKAVFSIGHFSEEKAALVAEKASQEKKHPELTTEDQIVITNLPTMLEEFLQLYTNTVKKKSRVEPLSLMRQRIVARADEFTFLDPFNPPFDYNMGVFTFTGTDDAFGENIARAIIECSWDVVDELRLKKKFNAVLSKWEYRPVLEGRGYLLVR